MVDKNTDFLFLLKEYRAIWNNRLLSSENDSPEIVIKKAIKRELLDENSHPRIRKNLHVKYYFAIRKIMNSSLTPDSKLMLIQLHNDLMEKLNEEKLV